MEEILTTLDRIVESQDDLEHWTMAIETTAKNMNKDMSDRKIQSNCSVDEKENSFCKGYSSRYNVLKSVEVHLPIMPESLQGFFSVSSII